jgi:hypothetical protein
MYRGHRIRATQRVAAFHQQVSYLRWRKPLGTGRQSPPNGFRNSHVFQSSHHHAEIQESAGIALPRILGFQYLDGFFDGFDFLLDFCLQFL